MANKSIQKRVLVTSANGATVGGPPIYIGGNLFSVQTVTSDSLAQVQVSGDKSNWVTADDASGTAASSLGDTYVYFDSRPQWARALTESDAAGAQSYWFTFTIVKED